jgi:hypothetical protein
VAGTIEGVNAGPSQLRPGLLQEAGEGENFRPHGLVQIVKFRLKLIANFNRLIHYNSMPYNAYAVKCIIEAE